MMAAQKTMPYYENLPQRALHPPITCSESCLEISSRNSATIHPGTNLHTTGECIVDVYLLLIISNNVNILFFWHTDTEVTSDVSSVEDNSCSTFSGDDSGFSDSRAYLKEPPPSSSEHAHKQREQGSDAINNCSSAAYASLNTRTGYYKSLNLETRVPGIYRCFLIRVVHYLHETIICISDVIYEQTNASGQPSS